MYFRTLSSPRNVLSFVDSRAINVQPLIFIGAHSFVRRRRNWITKYRINKKRISFPQSCCTAWIYGASRETELNEHPSRSSIFTIAPFRLGPRRIDTFGTYNRATGALKDCVPRRVFLASTTLAISSRDVCLVFIYYTDCNRILKISWYQCNQCDYDKKFNICTKTYDNNLLNVCKM